MAMLDTASQRARGGTAALVKVSALACVLLNISGLLVLDARAGGASDSSAVGYQLSDADRKLNCKQITGRMQLRILQIRDFSQQKQSSAVSRGIQSVFAATLGNSSKGIDPEGVYANDVKMLRAYNQLLVDKGCKSYDLDKELQSQDPTHTPTATIVPPGKPAKQKP